MAISNEDTCSKLSQVYPQPTEEETVALIQEPSPSTTEIVPAESKNLTYVFTQCNINDSTLSFNASSQQQQQDSNTDKPVPPLNLSKAFGKTCLKIAKCLDAKEKLDEIKVLVSCWASETDRAYFPDVQHMQSVKEFFVKAQVKRIWSWADHQNLVDLLEGIEDEEALKLLNVYRAELEKFHNTPLQKLVPLAKPQDPPIDPPSAWIDAKWEGNKSEFVLADLRSQKKVVAESLKVPESDLIFDSAFKGCLTIRWIILNQSHYNSISEKCCSQPALNFKGKSLTLKFCKTPIQPLVYPNCVSSYIYPDTGYRCSVPEYTTCGICLQILQQPMTCDHCFATFCKGCATKAAEEDKHCPVCREDFLPVRNEFVEKRILASLYVTCPKCTWFGELSGIPEHTCSTAIQQATSISQPGGIDPQIEETETPDLKLLQTDDTSKVQFLIDRLEELEMTVKEYQVNPRDNIAKVEEKIQDIKIYCLQYESFFSTADVSIASYRERKLSIMDKDPLKDDASLNVEIPGSTRFQDQSPLIQAHDQSSVKSEVKRPPKMYEGCRKGMGPLHLASWHGKADRIGPLVDDGEDINAPGVFGLTPLHIAALRGHRAVVFELLSHGANVHSTFGYHTTPAILAEEADNYFISQCLIARSALIQELNRLIHLSVQHGDTDLLLQLIKITGKSCDVEDVFSGLTLLQLASANGDHEMVEKLLNLQGNVNKRNRNGSTALLQACTGGSLKCVQLLIKNGANVHLCDSQGISPMHWACNAGHLDIVQELLVAGSSPNQPDATNTTPLHDAASQGNEKMIDLLLEQPGVEIEVKNSKGFTPLLVAVSRGCFSSAKKLLQRGANPKAQATGNLTALHLAASLGNTALLEELIKHGADIKTLDKNNRNALHFAVRSGILDAVGAVIAHGCPLDVIASDNTYQNVTGGMFPGQMGRPKTDDSEKQINSALDGYTPFHLASCFGFLDIVEYLYQKKANIALCTNAGYSPLHFAVQEGRLDVVRFLLKHRCCNPNEKTKNGLACLHLAALNNDREMAVLLIEEGCEKELKTSSKTKPRGLTPLLISAMMSHPGMVRTLHEKECNIDAETDDGLGALHLAVMGPESSIAGSARTMPWGVFNKEETIQCLLDYGADPNKVSSDGLTPLDIAVHQNNRGIINTLMAAKNLKISSDVIQQVGGVSEAAKEIQDKMEQKQKQRKIQEDKMKSWMMNTFLASMPSPFDLSRLVVPHVMSDWHNFGMHMEIDDQELDIIEKESSSEQECCQNLFKCWLQGKGKQPASWQTLFAVLRQVGKEALVKRVLDNVDRQNALAAAYGSGLQFQTVAPVPFVFPTPFNPLF